MFKKVIVPPLRLRFQEKGREFLSSSFPDIAHLAQSSRVTGMDKESHDEMKERAGVEAGFGGVDDRAMRKAVLKMDVRYVFRTLLDFLKCTLENSLLTNATLASSLFLRSFFCARSSIGRTWGMRRFLDCRKTYISMTISMRSASVFFMRRISLGSSTYAFHKERALLTRSSELPSNLVLKKMSPKIWLPLLTAVWGLLTMCLGFVHGFASFVTVRALLGVAEGGLLPGMVSHCKSAVTRSIFDTTTGPILVQLLSSQRTGPAHRHLLHCRFPVRRLRGSSRARTERYRSCCRPPRLALDFHCRRSAHSLRRHLLRYLPPQFDRVCRFSFSRRERARPPPS